MHLTKAIKDDEDNFALIVYITLSGGHFLSELTFFFEEKYTPFWLAK